MEHNLFKEYRKSHMFLNEVYLCTDTIYAWRHLLSDDSFKQVIFSLKYKASLVAGLSGDKARDSGCYVSQTRGGVYLGNGTWYNLADWNKIFTDLSPKDQNTGTNVTSDKVQTDYDPD